MGDRGHIYLHEADKPGIWLYAHWDGSRLPNLVHIALLRGQYRWDDPPYLNRIIFSVLVERDLMGTTNFGLDTAPADTGDGHRIVDVDHDAQRVTLKGAYFVTKSYSFGEYIDMDGAEWPDSIDVTADS